MKGGQTVASESGVYRKKAYLILEDGSIYTGSAIGADREVIAEIVFNTSMTGYQEILTDPSYAGQAVVMTYPLIGNYGVSGEEMESRRPWAEALLVRQFSRIPSNWHAEGTLQAFLERYDVPGIEGIDTRSLTRHLRDHGTMNGCVTTDCYAGEALEELLRKIRAYRPAGVVRRTTSREIHTVLPAAGTGAGSAESAAESTAGNPSGHALRVALLDLGAKDSIVDSLVRRGCEVTVYPAFTPAERILADAPDGIMLSNGPGDPKEDPGIIREVRQLCEADIPLFAICLGHQIVALAEGGDTYRLGFGHRGGNHPVKDMQTGRTLITTQNHGYAVDAGSFARVTAEEWFRNLHDGTNEGLLYPGRRIRTVQFHPEARPGPADADGLFDVFMEMMEQR